MKRPKFRYAIMHRYNGKSLECFMLMLTFSVLLLNVDAKDGIHAA